MVLLQGVLREPSASFGVIHAGPVVRERQTRECLILLAVEPITAIRDGHRCDWETTCILLNIEIFIPVTSFKGKYFSGHIIFVCHFRISFWP